ncbi:MAG: dihydropteroate synthase [Desulfitobacteriaceae bacterium]|nr:dihydropteroate synthase [Desulfitobacteriaceae bacterium]MDD4752423.1 dihydropteroate synthase [Desulfitobacteriaceae bacterium]
MDFNPRLIKIDSLHRAKQYLKEIGTDDGGQKYMQPKALFITVKLDNLSLPAAAILKQEMLSKGGEAAVHRETITHRVDKTSVILMGTMFQYRKLITKLKGQPFQLARLAAELEILISNLTKDQKLKIECVNGPMNLGERTYVMGIVNVTPDSFSDGGKYDRVEKAVEHAWRLVEEGADIIDIGGESTRPGFAEVSAEEEIRRIIPVLKELTPRINVPISVDTYKAEVGRRALEAGAAIINDIWGFQREPELAKVAAEYDCPVVLMHNQDGTDYHDLMGELILFLRKSIQIAESAGVATEKIIVDPGIGFGKDLDQNLEVMKRLDELKSLGKPVLLGTSRKSIIGQTLNLPVTEREEGTAATIALGIAKGVDIVRVHNVKEMVRVVKMTDAMIRR